MVGVALLVVVHVVGIDIVTQTNLRRVVVVVRHDGGNQHGYADNHHQYDPYPFLHLNPLSLLPTKIKTLYLFCKMK
jgi:hypothetical protein